MIHEEVIDQPKWDMFSPDFPWSLTNVERRPDGWAATSPSLVGRWVADKAAEASLLEIEIDEDGRLRLFCACGSWSRPDGQRLASEVQIAGLIWRVLRAASLVADKTLYLGNWDVGVAMSNTRWMASAAMARRSALWPVLTPFAADSYRSTTSATYEELKSKRRVVLERLIGRLNRALNDDRIPLEDFDALVGPG